MKFKTIPQFIDFLWLELFFKDLYLTAFGKLSRLSLKVYNK